MKLKIGDTVRIADIQKLKALVRINNWRKEIVEHHKKREAFIIRELREVGVKISGNKKISTNVAFLYGSQYYIPTEYLEKVVLPRYSKENVSQDIYLIKTEGKIYYCYAQHKGLLTQKIVDNVFNEKFLHTTHGTYEVEKVDNYITIGCQDIMVDKVVKFIKRHGYTI